jgi:hypothetical protein
MQLILLEINMFLTLNGNDMFENTMFSQVMEAPLEIEQKIEYLPQILNAVRSRYLLIFDNFEDILDPRGESHTVKDELIRHLLETLTINLRESRVIVTSRLDFVFTRDNRYQENILSVTLPDLTRMEAFRLIGNMPSLDRATDKEKLLIHEKAGGSPYIIDLVAARAKDVLIGSVLLDIKELQKEFVETMLLNKLYEWLPDAATKEFFRRASVYRRPVNQDFLVAMGGDGARIIHLLHKSLLGMVAGDLYEIHPFVRAFGFKRLEELDGASGLRDAQITAAQMYLNTWMMNKDIGFLLESFWFYHIAKEYNKVNELADILAEYGFIVKIKKETRDVYQKSEDSPIPSYPENKRIHDKIEDLIKEKDVTKQYEILSILIALIPTAQMIGGNLVTGDYVGGDKIIATNSSIVSKSSFSNAVNSVRNAGNDEAAKAIEDLAKLIENTNFKDKKETLESVESLAEEAAKPNPKKGTLRVLGESILNVVQKVPEIVEKATPLIKIISKLWLL